MPFRSETKLLIIFLIKQSIVCHVLDNNLKGTSSFPGTLGDAQRCIVHADQVDKYNCFKNLFKSKSSKLISSDKVI